MNRAHRRRLRIALVALLAGGAVAYGMFAHRVAQLRACRATGPGWSFPSRVYSDGVDLIAGRPLPAAYLIAQLEAREYREVRGNAAEPGTYARDGDELEIALRGFADAADPLGGRQARRVRLRLHEGHLAEVVSLGESANHEPGRAETARLEPVPVAFLFGDDRVWRTWVSIDRVPAPVRDAIVSSEDRRFRSHMGVDLRGTLRALVRNVRSGGVREGGSTITQQLARSLFLGRERALGRKLAEVPLALGLELTLGKRRILEMYLNSVYWGQAGGLAVGGIAEAALWYFDAPVESLGVLEGATLAAMIPAPNVFDPFERPRLVRERRNQVLRTMVESGWLSARRAASLAERPLRVRRGRAPVERFPSYVGYVRDVLARRLDPAAAAQHGLAVFTTMDLVWQQQAEADLAGALDELDPRGARRPRLEGAFVALEPATGAVRAMVGGRVPRPGDFNRAFQARRQTGSAIKPIVYAAALGRGFTPASTVSDSPRRFETDRGVWSPRNDDGTYHSQVTLAKALERSLNVATTNVVDAIGPGEVARVAGRFGLGRLKPVMSIGLGSNEATLVDLTAAFAVFGDRGLLRRPSPIRAVVDRSGKPWLGPGTGRGRAFDPPTRAVSEPVAALMTGLLQNVVRFGVAYPLRKEHGFTRPVAGKTGTTDEYKDAWFVGFTPDVVAGTWVGYDRPSSIGRLAAQTALPTWAKVVGGMLRDFPAPSFVSDAALEWRDVDPWTGLLAGAGCRREPFPFLPGTAPTAYCSHTDQYGPEMDVLEGAAEGDSAGTRGADTTGTAPADTTLVPEEAAAP